MQPLLIPLTLAILDVALAVDNTQHWSYADLLLQQVVETGTWSYSTSKWAIRQCVADNQCVANEVCLMSNQCFRGVCACLPPNFKNDTTDWCQVGTTTTGMPTVPLSITMANMTDSTAMVMSTTTATTPTTPKSFYGMACTFFSDCGALPGTSCVQNLSVGGSQTFCLCQAQLVWSPTLNNCKYADYGDPCVHDSDCNNQLYTMFGYACNAGGRCDCQVGYSAWKVASLQAAWGVGSGTVAASVAPKNRTYCVFDGVSSNQRIGQICTIDVISASSTVGVAICSSGLTCLQCAGDTAFGTCVAFVNPTTGAGSTQSVTNAPNAGAQAAKNQGNNVAMSSTTFTLIIMATVFRLII